MLVGTAMMLSMWLHRATSSDRTTSDGAICPACSPTPTSISPTATSSSGWRTRSKSRHRRRRTANRQPAVAAQSRCRCAGGKLRSGKLSTDQLRPNVRTSEDLRMSSGRWSRSKPGAQAGDNALPGHVSNRLLPDLCLVQTLRLHTLSFQIPPVMTAPPSCLPAAAAGA